MIKTEDLLFLGAVMEQLGKTQEHSLTIAGDNVIIYAKKPDGFIIRSAFALQLCEKYYNRVSKFIEEVL